MAATIVIVIIIAVIMILGILRYKKSLRSGCCGSDSDPAPKALRVRERDLRRYPYGKVLSINGMTCRNCAVYVQNALNLLDGVYAKVDLGRKEARIYMKENLPDQILRKAVADVGYTVRDVRAVGGSEL